MSTYLRYVFIETIMQIVSIIVTGESGKHVTSIVIEER